MRGAGCPSGSDDVDEIATADATIFRMVPATGHAVHVTGPDGVKLYDFAVYSSAARAQASHDPSASGIVMHGAPNDIKSININFAR